MAIPATSKSVVKYQGGRGFALVKLSDEKSQKVELENITLRVTNTVMSFHGSDSSLPVAYALGKGEATIEATVAQSIDEDAFRYLRGYEKVSSSEAIKGYFKAVGTIPQEGGALDLSDAIPEGAAIEPESLYVRLNATGEDLADSEYSLAGTDLTITGHNGQEVVIEGTYTQNDYEWRYTGDTGWICAELRLVFPLATSAGSPEKRYRVIKVPRAFVIPDININGGDGNLADVLRFRIVPDPAGYLFYESILDNP